MPAPDCAARIEDGGSEPEPGDGERDRQHEHDREQGAGARRRRIARGEAAGKTVHRHEEAEHHRDDQRRDPVPALGAEIVERSGQRGAHVCPAAGVRDRDGHSDRDDAQQHEGDLYPVGVGDGQVSADRGVEDHDGAGQQQSRAVTPAEQHLEDRGRSGELPGRIGRVGEHGGDRRHGASAVVVMLLDEIGIGEVVVPVAELLHPPCHEKPEQQEPDRFRQDVPDARDAILVDARRRSDDRGAADPGREPHARDRERAHAPAGHEIVVDVLLAALRVEAEPHHRREVDEQDDDVEGAHMQARFQGAAILRPRRPRVAPCAADSLAAGSVTTLRNSG